MQILGVKLDKVTRQEAVAKIASFLNDKRPRFLVTPNAEIILFAYKHSEYRDIINQADLAIPDGSGPVIVSKFTSSPLLEWVSGSDMVPEICRLAREKGQSIALIGGLNEEAIKKAAEKMRKWGNEVVFAKHGVPKQHWNDPAFHEKIMNEMRVARPDIILIAFGHPKQEQWIDKYRAELPSARLFMGCGGALDFIAGMARRAPSWMRKLGLEWLWRLMTEPKRIKRIFNAVIVFPLTVIYDSLRK